jgi:LysR substrate binding domain
MLAVSSGHPFARCASASVEDLGRDTVLRPSASTPDYWEEHCVPRQTPKGRLIERGQATETFQEMLTLIAAGKGIYPVGAQAALYYARPDVAYIPLRDAPPLEWGLAWCAANETTRLRAFSRAAGESAESWRRPPGNPGESDWPAPATCDGGSLGAPSTAKRSTIFEGPVSRAETPGPASRRNVCCVALAGFGHRPGNYRADRRTKP